MAQSFGDFMASKSAAASPAPSAPAPASSGGFDAFMKQKAASGHAPTFSDDVAASAKFLGNEIVGVGQALNPINIATGMYNAVVHPIDTGRALLNTPGRMYEQYQNGDMSGLAQGIGNIAGAAIGAKMLPGVPGSATRAAQTIGDAVDATAPYVKALTPVASKGALAVAKELPIVGSSVKAAVKAYDVYGDVKDAIDTVNKPAKAKAPTTTTTINPEQISPAASTTAMGTKPIEVTQSAGKGARTIDSLDPDTHQALADANRAGDIRKLPTQVKAELTQAVQAGDSAAVNNILSKHSSVDMHLLDAENKANAIAKYVQDHNIDLDQFVTKADRQALADSAYGHAVNKGMPIKGKYKGISDSTMQAVKDRLNGTTP